ncbi:MAG: antibiotic biosynthesis monooxygenase [Myxococcota bacterium]
MKPVYEVVVMRRHPGASVADVIELCRALHAWVAEQPGFLRRQLLHDVGQELFVDLIAWRSEEDAKQAMAASTTAPCMEKMPRVLDMESMTMAHAVEVALT